jgi:hypothetical protein
VRQGLEQVEIEMDQIVDGVEVGRPRRVTESRMRGCDDLAVRGKHIEERRLRVHRVQAMQQQDRRPVALAQDFEVDAAYCELLGSHRTPYKRSLTRIATLQPALIAADSSR